MTTETLAPSPMNKENNFGIIKYHIDIDPGDKLKLNTNVDFEPVNLDYSRLYEENDKLWEDHTFQKHSSYIPTFAEICAKRICGPHNKNVIITILGKQGHGKSNAALVLAVSAAKWIARIKGGRPNDYFDLERNLATIDPNMLHEIMKDLRKFNIYMLDDAGPGWDSRSSMSDQNKHLNYILQTARPSNNIIIITTIHKRLVDITVRRLTHFLCISEEVMHNIGLTFFSVKTVEENQLYDKTYYKFLKNNGFSFSRHIVKQIPKNLQDHYDKVRAEKQEMVQRHYKEMKNGRKAEKDKGPGKREQKRQEYITEYGDDVLKLVMEGTPRNSIATALGIPANQVTQIAKSFGYSYLNRQWRGV